MNPIKPWMPYAALAILSSIAGSVTMLTLEVAAPTSLTTGVIRLSQLVFYAVLSTTFWIKTISRL